METNIFKLIFCLWLTLNCTVVSLSAQVQVNQEGDVGIQSSPFINTGLQDFPDLSVLGRMDMRYPNAFLVNIVIGTRAGRMITNGSGNILLGEESGNQLTSGGGNILLGRSAGAKMTNAGSNVVIGAFTGTNVVSGTQNTFVGTFSGNNFKNSGPSFAQRPHYNVVIGHGSATSPGGFSFQSSGDNNVLIGRDVAKRIQGEANGNVGIGTFSLNALSGGINNLAIGYQALGHVEGGSSNVAIGAFSGDYNTGSGNVFIGNRSGPGTATAPTNVSDRLYIQSSSASTTIPLIYGEFNNDLVRVNGKLDVTSATEVDGKLTLNDVLNLDARSTSPAAPSAGDIYLDDGTNTGGAGPKLRYYNGSAWVAL